jgi:hypothetical protein
VPAEQGSDAGPVDAGTFEPWDGGRVDAGPSVVPSDLLSLDATSSGGFGLPVCRTPDGGYELTSRWHVELDAGTVEFTVCPFATDGGAPTLERGTRTLTAAQRATLDDALAGVTASSSTLCGADKSALRFSVATPTGALHFKDAFYACLPEADTTMVYGIDGVFDWLWAVSR